MTPAGPHVDGDEQLGGDDEDRIELTVRSRVVRIDAVVQGITTGLLAGLLLFVATNWLILRGGQDVGKHLGLLRHFFLGYEVTFIGSLIGFAWAFAGGFLAAYLVARIYNAVVDLRHGRRPERR